MQSFVIAKNYFFGEFTVLSYVLRHQCKTFELLKGADRNRAKGVIIRTGLFVVLT